MHNFTYNFDTTTDTQEYDFLTMALPVAPVSMAPVPISMEQLLFGNSLMPFSNEVIDYSAITPIPYQVPQPFIHTTNRVCCKSEFQDFEHETNLSVTMPYAAHDTLLAQKLMDRIHRDYASTQCESEAVRGILLTTYPNPYTNIFDISVQEKGHDDKDKHLFRYTWGRKDDIYSSVWYRNLIGGNERDGGERYCAPCNEWYNTRNHAWANHQTSVHGISAVTKTIYPFPSGVILDKKTQKLKGWCPKCQDFVHLYIKKVGTVWTTWFRHQDAHIRKEMQDRRGGKICTPNNPRNSKKRANEAGPSVDVSASNDVLDLEFKNKKRCFEVETEANYSVGELQDMMDTIDFEMKLEMPPVETQVEPTVEVPVETQVETQVVSTQVVESNAQATDDTEETEETEEEDDTEDTEDSDEESEDESDTEEDEEDEDTEDTNTSPEDEGEFKFNPFQGYFDDSVFGDYNF
ncbi:hypothetical protein CJU89_5212 [Yarrowia sp. B02]|nr:hypothetical protein CJU89_5212 [Yarrowia sp. B02]